MSADFSVNNDIRSAESLKRLKQVAQNLQEMGVAINSDSSIFSDASLSVLNKKNNLKTQDLIEQLAQANKADGTQIQEYRLFASLMDADGDGVIEGNEKEALAGLVSDDGTIKQEDLEGFVNSLGIGTEQGISDLIKDIDGILSDENVVADGKETGNPLELLGQVYNRVFGVNINGELDEKVKQQGTGDCYFLATLNSLNNTEQGKQIIKDSISFDPDTSTYTVTFKGIGESYSFTTDQVKEAEKMRYDTIDESGSRVVGEGSSWYSNGDDDALLLEMAFEQFRQDVADDKFFDKAYIDHEIPTFMIDTGDYKGTEGTSAMEGGNLAQVIYAFTGQEPTTVSASSDDLHSELDKIQEKLKNGEEVVVQASIAGTNGYTENENGDYYVNDNGKFVKIEDGTEVPEGAQRYSFNGVGDNTSGIVLNGVGRDEDETIKITTNGTGGHAISITAVSDTTVTIINPWDSAQRVEVDRREFESYMDKVSYLSMGEKSGNTESNPVTKFIQTLMG